MFSPLTRFFAPSRTCFLRCAAVSVVVLIQAPSLCAHGGFHERMQQLVAAIERNPQDARSHFELAEIFCQHGDWAFALASADSADERQPGRFPTDLVRGEALLGAGQPAKAKIALDRFVAAHPDNARARLLRARATTAISGIEAALGDFRAAAVATAHREPDHAREAAAALTRCGHRDEAINILARAIDHFGAEPGLLRDALELEVAAGKWPPALTRVAALQASAPRPEPWMARRAEILTLAGRPAEARAAWTTFLAHLESLPNLERGSRPLTELALRAQAALRELPLQTASTGGNF
jgi:tetratricopeptide (TPR) repeat protein